MMGGFLYFTKMPNIIRLKTAFYLCFLGHIAFLDDFVPFYEIINCSDDFQGGILICVGFNTLLINESVFNFTSAFIESGTFALDLTFG